MDNSKHSHKDKRMDHSHAGEHSAHESHSVHSDHSKPPEAPNDSQDQHGEHGDRPHKEHQGHGSHWAMVEDFKRRFLVSLVLTVPILLLSPMVQMFMGIHLAFRGDKYLLFGLSTVLFIYGGKPFIAGAADEVRKRSPGMMTLIAMAIIVAYAYSSISMLILNGTEFFWELATLIVIMLLGHWIEMRSVMGASKALEELAKLMPDIAHLVSESGEVRDVPTADLKVGDLVLVKPGEKMPIDGLVQEGSSSVNESMITGESVPVEKNEGDQIIGGSVNGEGAIRFRVNRTGEDTFLSQVISLVREAQESKSDTQVLADVAAKWLFYIALSAGIATFTAWAFATRDLGVAMERAVTVVIIACPHALGLAVPLVTAVSTGIAARKGLLIRNRASFENARKIDAVVFDKTGTLTKGEFGVTDISAAAVSERELLEIAYSLEVQSEHPIARGIAKEAERLKIRPRQASGVSNITGQGLTGRVDGTEVKIVSPGYLKSEGIDFDESDYEKLSGQGKTVIFVLDERDLLGYIALGDAPRDTARDAVVTLKDMQIESYMITGDNSRAAAYAGAQLGIDKVYAEVLPQEKASKIDEIKVVMKAVAMVGDGVNDAPALAKSDLGIAIGAGTDVAIEAADVILVKSNPLDVVSLLKLSRATYRKMVQNLIWATAYNLVALPLAAGVLYRQGVVISPALGAVLMSLSTIIVAINARLLKID